MSHPSHPRRRRAHASRQRADRRLVRTLASVSAAYAVTALVIVLVVTVVLPVAARHRALPSLAAVALTPGASPVSAAVLAGRAETRPSRSGVVRTMPTTVIRKAKKPARVAPRVVIRKITWALPVSGYRLTSRFGDSSWLWSSGVHTGLDFAAPEGTPIRSMAVGVVKQAGWSGSYGYRTIISLPGGGEAWYCHQSSVQVRVGQRVAAGEQIGTVGATGNVTGSHLHLEVRPRGEKGDPSDPYAVLLAHGLRA